MHQGPWLFPLLPVDSFSMVTAPLVVTNVCSCSQHHLMCPFQSHEQAWGLERL